MKSIKKYDGQNLKMKSKNKENSLFDVCDVALKLSGMEGNMWLLKFHALVVSKKVNLAEKRSDSNTNFDPLLGLDSFDK